MDYRELEETITRLESVQAVRILADDDRVTEVHVLAAPAKAPKQVVRDIQSLAMARFGTNIDRRVISVVQIAPEAVPQPSAERPALAGIKETPDGNRTTISVGLMWHGRQYVGSSSGPSVASARLRLIGEATLHAVEDLLEDGSVPLALDAVGPATVGLREILIAVVVSANGLEEEVAVGSAISTGDEGEATVRAVLDALNRRLSKTAP